MTTRSDGSGWHATSSAHSNRELHSVAAERLFILKMDESVPYLTSRAGPKKGYGTSTGRTGIRLAFQSTHKTVASPQERLLLLSEL